MYRMIPLFLCLLVAVATVRAQEPDRPEEVLRYFPEGVYTLIRHSDMTDVRDHEAYPAYIWYLEKNRSISGFESVPEQMLPAPLGDNVVSHTQARFVVQTFTRLPEPMELSRENFRQTFRSMREEGRGPRRPSFTWGKDGRPTAITGYFSDEGENIYVFRFDALSDFLAEAEKSGVIATTGENIDGASVYSFEIEGRRRWGSSSAVAMPTETNELLVAESTTTLRRMRATGLGAALGMLDQQEYADAFAVIPDLGHTWTIQFQGAIEELQMSSFEMQDLSDEELESIGARFESQPLFSVTSNELGEQVVNRRIEVYRDDEQAAEAFENSTNSNSMRDRFLNSPRTPEPVRELFQLRADNTTRELQDNRIVSVLSFDRAFMKQQLALSEQLRDEMEKRREEMEQQRGQRGNERQRRPQRLEPPR
jgi:hypothetical protein